MTFSNDRITGNVCCGVVLLLKQLGDRKVKWGADLCSKHKWRLYGIYLLFLECVVVGESWVTFAGPVKTRKGGSGQSNEDRLMGK